MTEICEYRKQFKEDIISIPHERAYEFCGKCSHSRVVDAGWFGEFFCELKDKK